MNIKENHLTVLKHLRTNARESFSTISRKSNIPVTTIFDNYQKLTKNKVITKHSSLIDFKKLGFFYRSFVFVKVAKKKELLSFLKDHPGVNSILRISKYDYALDVVFPTIKEYYIFLDDLRDFGIKEFEAHDVIEHIKQEEFLSN